MHVTGGCCFTAEKFDRAVLLEKLFFFFQEVIKLNISILYLFGKRKLPYPLPHEEALKASFLLMIPACLAALFLQRAKYDLLI